MKLNEKSVLILSLVLLASIAVAEDYKTEVPEQPWEKEDPEDTIAAEVRTVDAEAEKGKQWLDLSGRRTNNPQRGIYIRNGKKILIKK